MKGENWNDLPPLVVVVGAGGVGKTTLAAALALHSAEAGDHTLVMTFDPSRRLKDTLGIGDQPGNQEIPVEIDETGGETRGGGLEASLLDAHDAFDRLVRTYAPDAAARERILNNRYYHHLAGSLSGILEYMAVERLFEVNATGRFDRVILDTPPTRQALEFLEAPDRIVDFLDSGAIQLTLRPWFRGDGRLKATAVLGGLGRRLDHYLDEWVGLDLLRDMAEFFQAFEPLFKGFRRRAVEVGRLLRSRTTQFILVTTTAEERLPDALFFARRLQERGHRLGRVVANRIHPMSASKCAADEMDDPGARLLGWLGERDQSGLEALGQLLRGRRLGAIPVLADEPTDLVGLRRVLQRYKPVQT